MAGTPFKFLPNEVFQASLPEEEKALRDLFVQEYLLDFDPVMACIRIGFIVEFAQQFAIKLMQEPYVRNLLAQAMRKTADNPEEEKKSDLALIKHGLREAGQHGPYANRVQAWKTLAQIQGFDKPVGPSEDEDLVEQFRNFAQVVPV